MDSRTAQHHDVNKTSEERLALRLLRRWEEEVSRLKRELHDRLGPLHFAIGANVQWVSAHCPQNSAALTEQLRETLQLLEDTVRETRCLSADLRSDALNWGSLGLEEALSEYAARLEEQCHIPIQFSSTLLEEEALTPETASHVYGIVREALTNAVRHVGATEVTVTLDRCKHELLISTTDNGKGFNLATQLIAQTAGLEEMFARTQLIAGDLDIHTTPGGGTAVRLRAPLIDPEGQGR